MHEKSSWLGEPTLQVEAYPKCTGPDFVEPDSTPGVMTWDELLEYMDQLGRALAVPSLDF